MNKMIVGTMLISSFLIGGVYFISQQEPTQNEEKNTTNIKVNPQDGIDKEVKEVNKGKDIEDKVNIKEVSDLPKSEIIINSNNETSIEMIEEDVMQQKESQESYHYEKTKDIPDELGYDEMSID